jgi:hypothetical protein
MSAITNFSINLEAIPKELIVKGKKGSYINLTLFQKLSMVTMRVLLSLNHKRTEKLRILKFI